MQKHCGGWLIRPNCEHNIKIETEVYIVVNWEAIQKRKQDILSRVSSTDSDYSYCHVIGCKNPPTARTGKGLNRLYCRKHEDHFERHGSYFKTSYSAAQINPYRKAALKWIKQNEDKMFVSLAIKKVQGLYHNAGPLVEAFRLRGLKPEERAKAAWARLREKGVDPRVPLSIWLAIEMISIDETQGVNTQEYKWVQAAKIIHRQASGTHRRWEHERPDGSMRVQELHKFPNSRGLVLRHIGKQLEKAAELVVDGCLKDIRLHVVFDSAS